MRKSIIVLLALFVAAPVIAETINWTNPTTYTDNTAIAAADQAKIKTYLRWRTGAGAWTYFSETAGGKQSWTGTLPAAVGVTAGYSVSAALTGADGIERDSAFSPEVSYTRPFPVKVPGAPSGVTIVP
jgi:hypothetical protein